MAYYVCLYQVVFQDGNHSLLTVVPYAALISLHAERVCGILLFHIEKLEKDYGLPHGACNLSATYGHH